MVTSVTVAGKTLTVVRERLKKIFITPIQYKMNIHLNKFRGIIIIIMIMIFRTRSLSDNNSYIYLDSSTHI